MRQRARADNLTICYRKKQIYVSFSCVCPVIDNEFRHNIVKVVCGSTRLSPRFFWQCYDEIHDQFQDRRTKNALDFELDLELVYRTSRYKQRCDIFNSIYICARSDWSISYGLLCQ